MTSRIVDGDRYRQLARLVRSPRGLTEGEKLPDRYIFLATVSVWDNVPPRHVHLDRHGTLIEECRYMASYTPAVNDVVVAEFIGDDVIVWGKLMP